MPDRPIDHYALCSPIELLHAAIPLELGVLVDIGQHVLVVSVYPFGSFVQ
jgi:hypothetical protein